MSFPEKLQAVFDKYGTTELKIYMLLNLYDDVLAEFDKHLKEDEQFFIETTKKVREKALEEHKQKLQQLIAEAPNPPKQYLTYGERVPYYDIKEQQDFSRTYLSWLKKIKKCRGLHQIFLERWKQKMKKERIWVKFKEFIKSFARQLGYDVNPDGI